MNVFVPPEKPVLKLPELFTLPVTDSVVVEPAVPESSAIPPLAMVKVPPVGVTEVVWLFSISNVPSMLVRLAKALVVVDPFLTLKFPKSSIDEPATTLVTPCPPPVMVRVAPLPGLFPICRYPELLNALTFTTSSDPYIIISAPDALVNVPVTVTVFAPPKNPVLIVPELFTLPVKVAALLPSIIMLAPAALVVVPVTLKVSPSASRSMLPLLVSVPPLSTVMLLPVVSNSRVPLLAMVRFPPLAMVRELPAPLSNHTSFPDVVPSVKSLMVTPRLSVTVSEEEPLPTVTLYVLPPPLLGTTPPLQFVPRFQLPVPPVQLTAVCACERRLPTLIDTSRIPTIVMVKTDFMRRPQRPATG